MTVSAAVWEVVGGARHGGIVVREAKERTSEENSDRLLNGSLVKVLDFDYSAARLKYELLSGSGPTSGWVTTKSQGKELLRPWEGPLGDQECVPQQSGVPVATPLSRNAGKTNTTGEISYAQWQSKGKLRLNQKASKQSADDGESRMLVCPQCSLPIGDIAYRSEEGAGRPLHAECQAQLLLEQANEEDKSRRRKEAELKRVRRDDYGIGWKSELVPRNLRCARKMGFPHFPNAHYSLSFDESSNTARVVSTTNPAMALNLEYLALALQVRICEGREAMFSLDPADHLDRAKSMWQVKHFEPAWLAGTSMGEVMFQADVHLKELSMGEYAQPVLGMKSCFDLSQQQDTQVEWNAREWFVIRKAEVLLTGDGGLIPYVKMGVEAREQVSGKRGLEDAVLTSPDHPLVRYAEDFEHWFDLIAERKSVVHHLREMAKASVLAKFLVENEVLIEDPWFKFDVEADENTLAEIPQLWNERHYSQIEVKDGKIVNAENGISSTKHGLYGGADLAVPAVAARRGPPLTMATGTLSRAPTASGLLASGQEGFSYAAALPPAAPRGVDLDLASFDLASAKPWEQQAAPFITGSAFFCNLDGTAERFQKDHAHLFKSVFNPAMSDRRMEGDLFLPPDSTPAYLVKLGALVAEENSTRKEQHEHFLSPGFKMEEPGPLFPLSWRPMNEITSGQPAKRELHARTDYSSRMERMLKDTPPVFSKSTEDGSKFRIYRLGSLEVRTIQEHDGKEQIGVVFSTRGGSLRQQHRNLEDVLDDSIVRATQYVEGAQQKRSALDVRFYVVLETCEGDCVVTEKTHTQPTWSLNPEELEARNSFAKVTRTADCTTSGLTVGAVRRSQEAVACDVSSAVESALYAESVYSVACTV